MQKGIIAGLFCVALTLFGAVNAEKIAEVKAGKIKVANASWWGFDEADATKALQDAINSGASTVVVDYTGKEWICGKTLVLPSNFELVIADKVVITAKRGEFKRIGDVLIRLPNGTKNVTIRGEGSATLRMHQKDYANPKLYQVGEWRHTISLHGTTNVTIRNLYLKDSGGDGIYVGAGQPQAYCKNTLIENVTAEGGNRLGVAVISAEDLVIRNCRFLRTVGASPAGGIDFEPNYPRERLVNCVMENCVVEGNRGSGISVSPKGLSDTSEPISVTIKNCRSNNNGLGLFLYAIQSSSIAAGKGEVKIINCDFTNNNILIQDPVENSYRFILEKCKFSPNTKAKLTSPVISIICKEAGKRAIGGIYFKDSVMDCDAQKFAPVALLCQGSGAVSDQIAGDLKIRHDGKTTPFDFDAFVKERKAYFTKLNSLKTAGAVDLGTLKLQKKVRDAFRNNATFRGRVNYVQYAEKGEAVTVTARCVSGGYPGLTQFEVKSPSGKRVRNISFPLDTNKENLIQFTARETGYHTIQTVTSNRIAIASSRSGGALVLNDGKQVLLPHSTNGRLYFEVPPGVKEFQIGVSSDAGAAVALLDPAGKAVAEIKDLNSMELLEGKRTDASRSEIWALEIRSSVWQVTLRMYDPLLPLVSMNPDTLPLKGDPETVLPGAVPFQEKKSPISNAGFELIRNGLPLFWNLPADNAQISIETEKPFQGKNALRVKTTAEVIVMNYSQLKVTPGTAKTFTIQVRGKGSFRLEASNYTAEKRWIRPNTSSQVFRVDSKDWKEFTWNLTPPADKAVDNIRLLVIVRKDSDLVIDDLQVK